MEMRKFIDGMSTLSYYDIYTPSAFFPMSRRAITSCIGKGNRDFDIYHINVGYGVCGGEKLKWTHESRKCDL